MKINVALSMIEFPLTQGPCNNLQSPMCGFGGFREYMFEILSIFGYNGEKILGLEKFS